ncbi:PO22 protein, partial [Lanius ludovicianus]|nr:PO22 protein [Lanius ludovicianus]
VQDWWVCFKTEILRAQERTVPVCQKMSQRGKCPAWIGKELKKELRNKEDVSYLEGQVSQEICKRVVRACRKIIREAQLELNLATFVKDNKKCFYKYINGKRKGKSNLVFLLDVGGNLVTPDGKKAISTSVFIGKMAYPRYSCPPGLVDGIREQDAPPVIQEEAVRQLLSCLDVHKSMGPDGIHPRVTSELADELVKPLSIIYRQSWLTGDVSDDWKLVNVMPIHKKGRKEDPGNYRPVSLTSVPGKGMEKFILSATTQHLQDGWGIRPSQHGFRRGRSGLTNLISFYDQVTCPADAGKVVDVVCLDFSKAFDIVLHSKLLEKLAAHGLDRCTL